MNYLVTGGAGFIGSHITEELVRLGHEVSVFDNFSTGKHTNLRGIPVYVNQGDLRDMDQVESAVKGIDTVFHLAALCSVSRSVYDPRTTHDVNITGTLNLLEACRKAGVRRVVFSSSSSVYGESVFLPKHEGMIPAPLSTYAVSKLTGEHYCQVYWKTYGLETTCLRYFNVFGPRQDPDSEYAAVIPKFIHAALHGQDPIIFGDGHQSRDFTYVDNIVQANIQAAKSPRMAGEVANVACEGRLSLLELLADIERILDTDITPEFRDARQGDVKHSQASIKKAHELFDYVPGVDFEEGLQRAIKWYRQSAYIPEKSTIPRPVRAQEGLRSVSNQWHNKQEMSK